MSDVGRLGVADESSVVNLADAMAVWRLIGATTAVGTLAGSNTGADGVDADTYETMRGDPMEIVSWDPTTVADRRGKPTDSVGVEFNDDDDDDVDSVADDR